MNLIEDIKTIKSGPKELREFGITMAVLLGIFGGLFWWRGRSYYAATLAFSAAFAFLGLVAPGLLAPIYKAWMILSLLIGWVMTRVILTVCFFAILTPLAVVSRLFGKKYLDLSFNKDSSKSYWIPRPQGPFDKKKYDVQF